MKDIKDILIRKQKNEINTEETYFEITNLIKENGYFTGDDLKKSFDLGKLDKENDVKSNDNILEIYGDDLDEFVNFISMNGFFSKTDIDSWYKIGSINKKSDTNGDTVKEMCMKAFNVYLISSFD